MNPISPPVPASEAEVTAAWLQGVLSPSHPGISIPSAEAIRIGEGYGLSSRIFRFRWEGAGGPASVVVKLWETDGPAGTREVDFFRTFGGRAGIRLPTCLHAGIDPATRRGVIVMEDLGAVEQGDCLDRLDPQRALALSRLLASLHGRWWGSPELDEAAWLPPVSRSERGREYFRSRRKLFLGRFGDRLDGFARGLLDRIEEAESRSNEILGSAPVTLLHADLHLDNVVFESDTGRPIVLDWARAAKGPAALDLVRLLFEAADPSGGDRILAAYFDSLRGAGVSGLDLPALRRQVGGALLRFFATWTCGVARWRPKSRREEAMIDVGIERALGAVAHWRLRDPDLFRF